MDREIDGRQGKLCGGSLTFASGRSDQERMETAADERLLQTESQRKIDFAFTAPKRKNSHTAPYVPPHRRIQALDQNGVVKPKQSAPKPPAPSILYNNPEYKSSAENGYDSKLDYSASFRNSNFFNRNPSNQGTGDWRKNLHSIDEFSNSKENFHVSNVHLLGTGNNQVEDNTNDSSQIAQRVLKLVDTHVNTGLKEILAVLYEQTYGETIPPELLSKWKFCVTLKSNPQSLVPNRKFLDPIKQVEAPETKTVPASLDVSKLEKTFWVNIHRCKSVSELWGIIMDANYMGKVEKLSHQMQSFYKQLKTPNNVIMKNAYYALFDGSWHRVQCLQCDDTNATVLFIDRGDEDHVPVNKLHVLSSQFCTLPAQAIKMSLTGLELFEDFGEMQHILVRNLIDKSLFADVNAVKKDCLIVQVYCIVGDDNDGTINVNELIVDQMLEKLLDPKLHIESDNIVPARVSHLDKNIYVQLDIPSFKYMNLLMEKAVREFTSNNDWQGQTVVRHEVNTIYFVKSNEDQNWYRAKIMKFINESEIQVFLIDIGSITETSRENVIHLGKVCCILAKYPAQAIEIQLEQIPSLNSKMLNSLRRVVARRKNLFVKFISVGGNNNLPTVLLMRQNESGFFISINDALLILDEEGSSKQNDSVVQAQTSLSGDKEFCTSSMKSLGSSQNSLIESRLSTEKLSYKNFSTSSVKSTVSSQSSTVEKQPTLSSDYKDFDTSSIYSAKSYQNDYEIQRRPSVDKSSHKSFSTLSVNSTKSSQSCIMEAPSGLSIDKSMHEDHSTLSLQSKMSSQNSVIAQTGLSTDKYSYTDLSALSVHSTKSSQSSKMESETENGEVSKVEDEKILKIHYNDAQINENCIGWCLNSVLLAPQLPEDYFDVHVTLASDPSHFVIQLLRSKTLKFSKMVGKMAQICRSYNGPTLTGESIQVGQLYACKSSLKNNGDWCRAYVTEIRDKNQVSVYCCDYGSYKHVDVKNLVPLDDEFYRLPYQAVWAELHGVKPTSKEWSVRASLKFQELTQSKDFVSRVISKRDAKSKTFQTLTKIPVTIEVIYNLELIDTSSSEDINVAHLLVEAGVAEKG